MMPLTENQTKLIYNNETNSRTRQHSALACAAAAPRLTPLEPTDTLVKDVAAVGSCATGHHGQPRKPSLPVVRLAGRGVLGGRRPPRALAVCHQPSARRQHGGHLRAERVLAPMAVLARHGRRRRDHPVDAQGAHRRGDHVAGHAGGACRPMGHRGHGVRAGRLDHAAHADQPLRGPHRARLPAAHRAAAS